MSEYFLDGLPIWAVFVLLIAGGLVVLEVGFRVGRWYQERTPEETEGSTGFLVGSLLALLGFLLAITMGMAADRFDTRRGLVLKEANAIGTSYLRAGFLPAPHNEEVRNLFRAYVPLRIANVPRAQVVANIARSTEIQAALWTHAEAVVAAGYDSDVIALFIDSLNEVIDVHEERLIAGQARVPESIIVLLVIGGGLSVAMIGFNAGLTRRRSLLSAVIVIVVLAATITLVLDLDRPQDGFLTTSQRALMDLQRQIGEPTAPVVIPPSP